MNAALERAKSQMRKGVLEYGILLILSHRRAYSADLLMILKENELIVVEGTLYPLLSRLRKDGLVSYSWVESTQGPPRKYYVITDKGAEYLRQLKESWQDLVDSMSKISSDDAEWHQLPTTFSDETVEVEERPHEGEALFYTPSQGIDNHKDEPHE